MTDEELNQIHELFAESKDHTSKAIAEAEARTSKVIAEAEARTSRAIDELRAQTTGAVAEAEARSIETMRDMQTEILRGLERFAKGNFARLHRLEVSDNDLVERLNALEERILVLETRRPA